MSLSHKDHPIWIILGETLPVVIRAACLFVPMLMIVKTWDTEWYVIGSWLAGESSTTANSIKARFTKTDVQLPLE